MFSKKFLVISHLFYRKNRDWKIITKPVENDFHNSHIEIYQIILELFDKM